MIIKSHIRGGFRSAAAYLKEQGQNEKTRLVEMSDPHVKNLDEAFRAMWAVADGTKVKKPLHHVSINPMKDERLTDKQVLRICEKLEEKYGYAHGEHQRVIVEHIKDGRQHFHVIWSRVSMVTGKPHYPYMHKKQSKIAARAIEAELGLKKPTPRRGRMASGGYPRKIGNPARAINPDISALVRSHPHHAYAPVRPARPLSHAPIPRINPPASPAMQQKTQPPLPHWQVGNGRPAGMSDQQWSDYIAACEGRLSWRAYFERWGNVSLGGGLKL
jgi:hypothetical protein